MDATEEEGEGVRYLTIRQVADRLGIARSTAYLLCRRLGIEHLRVGFGRGTIRVSEDALRAFIERATVRPEAGPATAEKDGPRPRLQAERTTSETPRAEQGLRRELGRAQGDC
jgi:excisionase family DNA binding protein